MKPPPRVHSDHVYGPGHSAGRAVSDDRRRGKHDEDCTVAIATADLGSDGGVIDGRARVHWRDGARFPAAGDGSALFIIYVDLRRSIYV